MFKRKAFIHWFLNDGVEEAEFIEALNAVKNLIEDYY